MSRTFRTNKYGEVKTDKFKKGFNGCGCAYCELLNKDFRNDHKELSANEEIKAGEGYIEDWSDEYIYPIDDEDYWLDNLSNEILEYNQELTVMGSTDKKALT
tara:strand:- start:489 stop:794 length:306 start_codon:yes stop_codon:yes gene_type:complete